jgi:type I restriction enzyme S subunit
VNAGDWREVRLGDVCTYSTAKVSITEINEDNYISTENMLPNKNGVVKSSGLPTVASVTRYFTDNVLVSNIRPYFKKIWCADREGGCSNDVLVFVVKDKRILDSRFLFYCLSNDEFFNYVMAGAKGTKMPRGDKGAILKYPVHLPTLSEQKAIAATLSALDDMIELNNQINKTLEEMAQAIFKSWFVDFEPFKDGEFEESELGMIPKGWNVKRIDQIDIEITDYVANGSFAALKENVTLCDEEDYAVFIRNVDLKANSFNKFVDKKSYEFLRKTKLWGGEVIISNVGDVGSVFRCPLLAKPMTLGNNMIMLKSISPVNYNLFLYILFKYSYGIELIKSITSGSAQPKFNKTDFRNLKIIVPPKEVIQLFNNIVEKLYRIVDEGIVENQLLSTVRDTLLPKLMSGEIRVPVEGAM